MSEDIDLRPFIVLIASAIPGAPQGVLGGFIQDRLAAYVEPQRAGTPRGETIGFSRKKYHAVLLAMTNIDLKKQAQIIGVTAGVLRTWRAEPAFQQRLRGECFKDFLCETIPNAGELGLRSVNTLHVGSSLKGFDDAHLYSFALAEMIWRKGLKAFDSAMGSALTKDKLAVEAVAEKVIEGLRWVLPISRVYRTFNNDDRWENLSHLAGLLATMQVLIDPRTGEKMDQPLRDLVYLIALLIANEVTCDHKFKKELRQIRNI
jgi:hypothetical protein